MKAIQTLYDLKLFLKVGFDTYILGILYKVQRYRIVSSEMGSLKSLNRKVKMAKMMKSNRPLPKSECRNPNAKLYQIQN